MRLFLTGKGSRMSNWRSSHLGRGRAQLAGRAQLGAKTAGRIRAAQGVTAAALAAGAAIVLASLGWSQTAAVALSETTPAEFQFVRLAYPEAPGAGFRRGQRSLTDWPEAENHLLDGVRRLTRIDAAVQGEVLSVMDERLFSYPWLYAVEVGNWSLGEREAERLREYLLRGGSLMVDDFHGTREWSLFLESMERVFPDRPIVDIPPGHSLFHVVYDLDEPIQIPGISTVYSGVTYDRDGIEPHWRGIYDDEDRLMVIINFNMDLGDAWEHADTPQYPVDYTIRAYEYAINYITYAMTH